MIQVRAARAFDAQAMAVIVERLTRPAVPVAPYLREWLREDDIWFVAEVGNEVSGFQWAGAAASRAGTCEIATFVPVGRNDLTIASALFDATRLAARTRGFRWIEARLPARNGGGQIYYRSRGFEARAGDGGTRTGRTILSYRL